MIDPDKRELFLEQSKTGSALIRDIEDYGRVLYSGWGQDPPESISDRIERAYFWDDEDWEEEFANLSVKDSNTLRDAARNGELETVRYLIRKGVNINSADKNGWTSLHHAAYGGSSRIVQYLINNGANIHAEDTVCGRKPIHIAAREGNTGIVRLFLSKGIGVNDTDENSWVPLHYAAWNGYLETAKFLVDEGANIHAKDATHGKKAVHIAAGRGYIDVAELFLRNGVGIDDTDKEGRTLLYYAVWKGNLKAVKFLAGKGANVHVENTYGAKLIHAATLEREYQEIIEFLLSKGIDIDGASKENGHTPLHCTAHAGKLGVVEFLIRKGANIYAEDNDGKTPSDLARKQGHLEVVDILGGTKKKGRLLETTSDNPELYLSGVTVKKQPKRSPGF
ncbi:MAG: ankyrin repeat domain-containing protein [Rickettsiales bacterium]|nr:ankyrin repeat domain-containing protein [Rickettsiales bacterium]